LNKIRNLWIKQQPRDSFWTEGLTNKFRYIVRIIVVTYLYGKCDERYVIRVCTEYLNCLQWNTRWFVCLLNLVTCSLSPLYTPVYDIIKMCNVLLYIYMRSTHIYISIYFLPRKLEVECLRISTRMHGVTFHQSISSNGIACNSYFTVP